VATAGVFLVPVRCPQALVPCVTPPLAPDRLFLRHGCRPHAAGATWLRQPCS